MPGLELIHDDRRADRRYDRQLEMRFCYRHGGRNHSGVGHTHDFSRGGIRFRTETPPPVGVEVELCIDWPFRLQNIIPLQLFVYGIVLRDDSTGTVVRISRYAFRTCGETSFDQEDPPQRTCNITA
jgi:hypothetical protein